MKDKRVMRSEKTRNKQVNNDDELSVSTNIQSVKLHAGFSKMRKAHAK
jgi:hypothetical protein